MTYKQLHALRALRDQVLTPDRFCRNGRPFDSVVPGTILESLLELLADQELILKEGKVTP